MPKPIKVSDQSYNSYNFRVLTAGIDLARFKANPIMLFNHTRANRGKVDDVLPIGTWKDIELKDDALYATPVFDSEDEFAAKIEGKFDRGVLRSASIGIQIHDLQKEGLDDQGNQLFVVTKCQLTEISLVDIPSNENAVAFYDEYEKPLELSAVLALATSTSSQSIKMNYSFVVQLLGLSASSDENAVRGEIEKLLLLKSKNANLVAENKQLKDAAEKAAAAADLSLVDSAIESDKILPADKDKYLKLLKADRETVTGLLESMPSRKTLKAEIDKNKDGVDTGKKTFTQMRKEDPEGLAKLKHEDFDSFNELFKQEFGTDYKS
ncbi:MAG: HK97 family phage prohead protease [Bacteroidota bacterium]